jgi:hypothetical protein
MPNYSPQFFYWRLLIIAVCAMFTSYWLLLILKAVDNDASSLGSDV